MSEEIKIDEKFQKAALFDLNFEKQEQTKADMNHESAGYASRTAEYHQKQEEEKRKWSNEFSQESKPLQNVEWFLKHASPELKTQATRYLDTLMNKSDYDLRRENRKNKEVDLDGSKKSLWGKLKNKAKNFWYPNNIKKGLEDAIGALKEDMVKNPEFYDSLKLGSKEKGQNKVSFNEVLQTREKTAQLYNNMRVDYMVHKEEYAEMAQRLDQKAKASEATIEAIHQVRDKAAKEIELRATARETTGIKDAQANTGIDRLEDKAKMMEGMSPQQRLAFRMSQLRGTAKETPAKPVEKREVDSNVMNKALESKMRA